MNQADFLHADCDAITLVKPTLYSISLTFKCQFSAVLLVKPMVVAEGSYEIGTVHLYLLTSGCFLEVGLLDFSEFWHSVRNP